MSLVNGTANEATCGKRDPMLQALVEAHKLISGTDYDDPRDRAEAQALLERSSRIIAQAKRKRAKESK